ncbi:double-stranded RNA-binding protein Staufen homolog 2-like, partial [Heteronotia binoei]|uniref:double-stranded RNA-binding protein Staufen homolog 2-like n=1 Tax=Heteronotia binoei TaxID=13085 RepID=UPI00292D20EC
MAQVKTQTVTNHSGPALTTPATPAPSVMATSSVGLQSSVNGSVPELAVDCNNSTAGLVDCTSSPVPFQDNMVNPKEKTPMCLVNELARFNRIQPLYKLLNERGPAHAKMFTVQLTLGEQTWEAEGSSIKKAHHSAASKALSETTLPKPTPRPPKNNVNNNPDSGKSDGHCAEKLSAKSVIVFKLF